MSRQDRLLSKRRAQMAANNKKSGLVQEQVEEEQAHADSLVKFTERKTKPLEYTLDGVKHIVPAVADNGEPMDYHDQHYQITRLKNGLEIEAKRMQDYVWTYEDAEDVEADISLSSAVADEVESEEYAKMKAAHEAQHPQED